MNRRLDLALTFLAALTAAACGSDGDGDGSSSHGDIGRYLEGACARAEACGEQPMGSTDVCGEGRDLYLCGSKLANAELPGVDACLAALDATPCEQLGEGLPEACAKLQDEIMAANGYTVAKVGEGCNLQWAEGSQVCAHDAYCDAADGQCGTCVARKENGQECFSPRECVSDNCTDEGVCQDLKPMGAACEDSWECSEACVDGKCAPEPVILGRACSDEQPCSAYEGDDRYRCAEGKCAAKLPGGAACTADEDCEFGCEEGKCVETSACGAGEEGDHCSLLLSNAQCKAGLVCDWDTDSCVKLAAIGEECGEGSTCVEGAYCFYSEQDELGEFQGTCLELKADGRLCNDSSECQSGYCDGTKCAPVDLCQGQQESEKRLTIKRAAVRSHGREKAAKKLSPMLRLAAKLAGQAD